MLRMKQREVGGAVIVDVEGNLLASPRATKFRSYVNELMLEGKSKVVINLSNVKWLNSLGVGMLVGALTRVRNAGGDMVLTHVTDRIDRLFVTTQLNNVFKTFGSEDEALRYLMEHDDD